MKSAFLFIALFGLFFVKVARSQPFHGLDFDDIYNERYENLI